MVVHRKEQDWKESRVRKWLQSTDLDGSKYVLKWYVRGRQVCVGWRGDKGVHEWETDCESKIYVCESQFCV